MSVENKKGQGIVLGGKRDRFYFFYTEKAQCFFGFLYFTLKLTLKNGDAFWAFFWKKKTFPQKKFPQRNNKKFLNFFPNNLILNNWFGSRNRQM